jgi:hypothetical protein
VFHVHVQMNVGSIVRARRRIRRSNTLRGSDVGITTTKGHPQSLQDLEIEITQRAVIATIESHNGATKDQMNTTACVIWESIIPQPISINKPFIISPKADYDISLSSNNEDEEETEIPIEQLLPLYPFENTSAPLFSDHSITATMSDILLWKECGDTLYQIHDVVAAIPYYEHALYLSCNCNQYQVGTTIFLKDSKGYIITAEIDCIDIDDNKDDPNFDISIIGTGDERTIQRKDILLCLLSIQEEMAPASFTNISNDIQTRILLNLSRCLLQLVDLVSGVTDNTKDPQEARQVLLLKERFCKSVVLATSLALVMMKLHHQGHHKGKNNDADGFGCNRSDALLKLETSALLLRSKAQCQLKNKMKHAVMDLQRISSSNKEAQQLLRQIQVHEKHIAKTNQRLAKNVSQWIQTTLECTENGDDTNNIHDENESTSRRKVCSSSITRKDDTRTIPLSSSSFREPKLIHTTVVPIYHHLIQLRIPILLIIIILVIVNLLIQLRPHRIPSDTEIDEAEF